MDVGDPAAPAAGVRPLALYFLKLGAIGFGGPIALTGAMQRTLVEERQWITPRTFLDGLALAQLAPGPLAAQLAMYIGYTAAGAPGALLVGAAFILPSLLMVWVLSAVYVAYGGLGWMQALFHGVGAIEEEAAASKQLLTCTGQDKSAPDAIKKSQTEIAFEIDNLSRQSGLSDPQSQGRTGDGAEFGDGYEGTGVSQVHPCL